MAWKPTFSRQRLLEFPPEPGNVPGQQSDVNSQPNGGTNALQDDHARTVARSAADLRQAPQTKDFASDAGKLRQRTEEPAPSLDGAVESGLAGQQSAPDRGRSIGSWRSRN
jgi:hypothetical protein